MHRSQVYYIVPVCTAHAVCSMKWACDVVLGVRPVYSFCLCIFPLTSPPPTRPPVVAARTNSPPKVLCAHFRTTIACINILRVLTRARHRRGMPSKLCEPSCRSVAAARWLQLATGFSTHVCCRRRTRRYTGVILSRRGLVRNLKSLRFPFRYPLLCFQSHAHRRVAM